MSSFELGRERPLPHPGRVRLDDADDPVQPGRRDAGAGAGAAGGRRGRRHERVGAVVDVEQRRLAGLEQYRLAAVEGLVEQQPGVADHRTQPLGVGQELLDGGLDRDRAAVVDLGEDLVLQLQDTLDLGLEDLLVEQVLDPDADPVHLVGVRRSDPAARGAQPTGAEEALGDLVEGAVVVGDDVGAGAHLEQRGVHAARLEAVDLLEQDVEVDHHAVADHRRAARGEDAAGQQVQRVLLLRLVITCSPGPERMTTVWPALLPPLNFTT